jgi:hypothetical protein
VDTPAPRDPEVAAPAEAKQDDGDEEIAAAPRDEVLFDIPEDEDVKEIPPPASLSDAKPPRQEIVLEPPAAISRELKGRMLLYKFDACGWMIGTVQRHYIAHKKYNVEVWYQGDDGPRDQQLDLAKYSTDSDGPVSSWCLLTDP